ncbi:zinc-ribbon domain-containing protein [Devosia neptuniae]|uniref:Zinc-ribbon domain-containing protein n=1 Tax=Devosia neptuniae TaxID=191302 RepID=A0ABY6CNT9_9HYPH|nr:zinc-ribbon domain-containing protein [Devosia neptuniae]UXN71653.1 zinc-ribbon domain-containing protein [Devosia neptuniae]
MIITCPHCQTKYQVTYEAIGSVGRKVQCAYCQRAWQQEPVRPEAPPEPADQLFEAMAEDGLDEALAAEEKAVAAELAQRLAAEQERETKPAGELDPAVIRKRQKAFLRRQSALIAHLPLARLRRAARVGGALVLCGLIGLFYFGRVQLVERIPSLAGVYASLGMGVNVVGLDFSNITAQRALRDGKDVLIVSAQLVGLLPDPVAVPPVVVTLLDPAGAAIYEWSVTPSVRDLMAGERSSFDTQLALPPGEAARMRLSFGATAGNVAPRQTTPISGNAGPSAPQAPISPEHP